MNSKLILLLSLISLTISSNSGVKVAIDADIIKTLKLIDFNAILIDQILIPHIQESGQFIFKYDLTVDNLTVKNITNPKTVEVNHSTSPKNTPLVKFTIKDITIDLVMAFYVKFGVFSEKSDHVKVHVILSDLEGEMFFDKEENGGNVTIQNCKMELSDLKIDMESKWMNFLIGIFKNLITKEAEKGIKEGTNLGQKVINDWIHNITVYDIGFGIGINITNTEKPVLSKLTKQIKRSLFGLFFGQKRKNKNAESVLFTTGVHGSIYPNLHPELKPKIPDPVKMNYDTSLFSKNEIQALVSDYSINTVFNMAQQTGFLHYEFSSTSNTTILPWKFTVKGLKDILPEYPLKYPNNDYQVQMKVYISPIDHVQPLLQTDENGNAKFNMNFGLDFDTFNSTDPFDDPVKDLKLYFSANVDIKVTCENNILSIKLNSLNFTHCDTKIDLLNVDIGKFEKVLVDNIDKYIYPELYKYIKEVKVVELLKNATKIDFRDFTVITHKGYYIGSIGIKGL